MLSQPRGHHGEKPSETLVRLIVERSLGVRVCCYDDRDGNSKPDAIITGRAVSRSRSSRTLIRQMSSCSVPSIKSTDAPSSLACATATGCP